MKIDDVSYNVWISIHALLAESDLKPPIKPHRQEHFYPRSPCGERHDTSSLMKCQAKFLSTLSLRRATAPNRRPYHCNRNFYPRSPCGERLDVNNPVAALTSISIHALLAESDF